MKITDVKCEQRSENRRRVSALMDGSELWFDIPAETSLSPTYADGFAMMGLVPAMKQGRALEIDPQYPISQTLYENLFEIQKIFRCWNARLQEVEIRVETTEPAPPRAGVGCLFSGGVDSLYTLLKRQGEVTDCVLIGGFDMHMASEEFELSLARNEALAYHLGARIQPVFSNQLEWGLATGIRRNFFHSAYLVASASLFGFERVYLPSTHTYAELLPAGSHPVLDRLWSNGTTDIVHADMGAPRTTKTAAIANDPYLLENLRVCWKDQNENCGECGKCQRTMLTLELLGLPGPFPRAISLSDIRRTIVNDWEGMSFVFDNRRLAVSQGRADIAAALDVVIRRYHRNLAILEIDRGFLGGILSRLRKRFVQYDKRIGFD